VISVDTKKKELLGAFKNTGRQWRPPDRRRPGHQPGVRLSPDGRRIAMDLVGVLWVLPAPGGPARRLPGDLFDIALGSHGSSAKSSWTEPMTRSTSCTRVRSSAPLGPQRDGCAK
jgi:hypothetical protein